VGERQLTFVEPPHIAPTGQRLDRRTLITEIRYPRARRPFPLLMFAPGFMQCGGPYSALLEAWASAGYVVVVVDFPRTDCRVGAAAYESDLVNQPQGMSYVLSRLLAQSTRPDGRFPGY
jgi:predicted dienelactone hydrolase